MLNEVHDGSRAIFSDGHRLVKAPTVLMVAILTPLAYGVEDL